MGTLYWFAILKHFYTKVRIYDRDRTICDVLKNMSKMDKEIFNKAIQGYVNDPKKNIPNLMTMILQIKSFTSSIELEYPRSRKSTSIVALLSKLVKV